MVGGVDGPSFDSVRCLSGFQVDDVDQRFGAVPVPFHTLEKIILVRRRKNCKDKLEYVMIIKSESEMDLKHVVKKVHSCAAHVDGYRVEEEDRVVFRHTELVDHRAVRNMEAFANLLVQREHSER